MDTRKCHEGKRFFPRMPRASIFISTAVSGLLTYKSKKGLK